MYRYSISAALTCRFTISSVHVLRRAARQLICVLCSLTLALPLQNFLTPSAQAAVPEQQPDAASAMVTLVDETPAAEIFGLKVKRVAESKVASLAKDVSVLVRCGDPEDFAANIANVSRDCGTFSILSSAPISIEVPYDLEALPPGISEEDVKLYQLPEVASAGPMREIDSHIDLENKKTVATLTERAGRYFNGVLKTGERPDRPPVSLSGKSLEELQKVNPVAGLPLISPPQPTPSGDLVLSYPLEFPGTRANLKPSIGIQYSAQSTSGNVANGWSLTLPTISVETKWGVPQFDANFETETYLFNGEQLVPEAGSYLDEAAPSDSFDSAGDNDASQDAADRRNPQVRLVPLPHRTTALRPRKKDNARFVLRRDEGLWRFVRHGDTASTYWWEAWQENPEGDTVKVSYFGNAPGRIKTDHAALDLRQDAETVGQAAWSLSTGPVTTRDPAAIMRWGIAREKDAFGNIVDYDWMSTCAISASQACNPSTAATGTSMIDRDLYLKRVIYYSHDDLEETFLRCSEEPSLPGCRRKQGTYEIGLVWSSNAELTDLSYRSDARSGGLTVPRRLLSKIDVRFRQRETEANGDAKSVQSARWFCSDPIAVYKFTTTGDPLFSPDGVNILAGAPRWLQSIEKLVPDSENSSGPIRLATAERAVFPTGNGACGAPGTIANPKSLKTVFSYQTAPRDPGGAARAFATAPYKLQAPAQMPSADGLLGTAGSLIELAHGAGKSNGPFRPSFLGSTITDETSGGVYIGISIGNPGKAPGAGYKSTYNSRTSHQEVSLLQEVTGDGLTDLLVAEDGRWSIFPGLIGTGGQFLFSATRLPNTLPIGFKFQYEPVQSGRYSGFEAHGAPGIMAGFSSGKSSSVQTVYMSDMDGDGRVDVVTPNGIFYNGSGDATLKDKLGFASESRYIGAQAAFRPNLTPSDLTVVRSSFGDVPELKTLTTENPRYDTVRTWRAPFDGLVWVRGAAEMAVEDDRFGFADASAGTRDPNARARKFVNRDGVIVTVEHSSTTLVGDRAKVCDAFTLSPGILSKPQVPSPDAKGTWRIAGSTKVREFGLNAAPTFAQYVLSVAGFFREDEKTAIDLHATLEGATEVDDLGRLSEAFTAAVDRWNSAGKSGTLQWNAEAMRLTYTGTPDGALMEPLLVEMPIIRDLVVEANEKLEISLVATAVDDNTLSFVAGDQGAIETEIFDGDHVPRGMECVSQKELAAEVSKYISDNSLAPEGQPGLFVSVTRGDVLYMRVNSIDDGNEDIVQWNPTITYLRAEEERTYIPADETFPFSEDMPRGRRPFQLVNTLLFDFANEKSAAILQNEGTLCQGDERKLKLCDVLGRSLIRYKSVARVGEEIEAPGDAVQIASATGEVTAQFNGKIALDGELSKPETAGLVGLAYSVLPAGSDEKCDVGRYGTRDVELNRIDKDGKPSSDKTFNMSTGAGSYQIASSAMNSKFIGEGDRICLFLRYAAPRLRGGQAEDFTFWAKDAARISFDRSKPVSVRYLRYLDVLPRDEMSLKKAAGTDVVTTDLCFADAGAVVDLDEDPPEVTHPDVDVPSETRTRPILRPNFSYKDQEGVSHKSLVLCRDVNKGAPQLRSLLMPKVDGASHDTMRLSSQWGIFRFPFDFMPKLALQVPVRMPVARAAAITPDPMVAPTSSSCSADDGLVLKRFALELKAAVANESNTASFGRRVATLRYSGVERNADGQQHRVPLRPFAVLGANGLALPISTAHLIGNIGTDERLVEDEEADGNAILQELRLVRGAPGTVALTKVISAGEASLQADQLGLPSGYVGYTACVHKESTLEIEAAIAPPRSSEWKVSSDQDNKVLDRLIGVAGCVPFSDADKSGDEFDGEGSPTNGSRSVETRICPITSADVRYPVLDKLVPRAYAWTRREVPVTYQTDQLPHDDNKTRVSSTLEAQNHRGSALLSIRHEEATAPIDLVDVIEPAKSCEAGNCIAGNPGNLRPLPTLDNILKAFPPINKADAERIQKTVGQSAGETCSAQNPANGSPPQSQNDDPLSCDSKKSQADPLLAGSALAYPLPVAIKGADPQKGAMTCNGVDLDFSGRTNLAAGPSLSDRQNLLSMMSTGKIEDEAKAPIGVASSVDICQLGPDAGIWAESELLSSSRLGTKDIHQGLRAEKARLIQALTPPVVAQAKKSGLPSLAKSSKAENTSMTGSFGASVSWSTNKNESPVDVIDMNGDGYPDLVTGGLVTLTDPTGGLRCSEQSVWKEVSNCGAAVNTGQSKVRASGSEIISGSFGYPTPTPTYIHANTVSNGSFGTSTTGMVQGEGQGTNQPRLSGLGVSVDLGQSKGERRDDILDMNGDGLPDIVRKAGAGYDVSLNLGGSFAPFKPWPAAELFRDIGTATGAGINTSYSTPDGAFGGGLDAGIGTSDQNQTIADINGDGLNDIIYSQRASFLEKGDAKPLFAKLSTGSGFTAPVSLGKPSVGDLTTIGRSETDRTSTAGQFSAIIPVWPLPPIYLVINPNFASTSALTRQPILFRDIDSDGLPDLVVGHGARVGNITGNFGFSNDTADIISNGLSGHGLLTGVWLPTNPAVYSGSATAENANYAFKYARTPKTVGDPYHRWTLSEVSTRDGIDVDDGPDVANDGHRRRTCIVYDQGFYDRYERRFLGYGRVDTVEGCTGSSGASVELHQATAQSLNGIRRTERHYANRTVYETGLMLEEKTFDLSRPISDPKGLPDEVVPQRWSRNVYILVDTALSNDDRFICQRIRTRSATDDASKLDAELIKIGTFGTLSVGDRGVDSCRRDLLAAQSSEDPSFDFISRRLTPTLIQTVQENREEASGASAALVSALQVRPDNFARATSACELGEIDRDGDGNVRTSGAICSSMDYDQVVRPTFTHAATGGGILQVDQRNRVKEIRVYDFKAGQPVVASISADASPDTANGPRELRRRSANYDHATGSLRSLCEFADLGSSDVCDWRGRGLPSNDDLEKAARAGITMRSYDYDAFGNLAGFIGPMGSQRSYAAKRYLYDSYLNLVETAEQTSFCKVERDANTRGACNGAMSYLGELVSAASTVDYRHAASTTTVDTNQNVLHRVLDPLGRPVSVYANWGFVGPACTTGTVECAPEAERYASLVRDKPIGNAQAKLRRLVQYRYEVANQNAPAPSAVVERYSTASAYRNADKFTRIGAAVVLPSRVLVDQMGEVTATVDAAEVCTSPDYSNENTLCPNVDRFSITGVQQKDSVGRPVVEFYPTSVDRHSITEVTFDAPVEKAPARGIRYDGFDRPLVVSLPDGNSYDFQYRVAPSLNSNSRRLRHRSEMRNALCIPSVIERDVRGSIRTVVDTYSMTGTAETATADLASSAVRKEDQQTIAATPFIEGVKADAVDGASAQQIQICDVVRGDPFELGPAKSATAYEVDALSQLVAVDLPNRRPSEGENALPSQDRIYVAYDAMGRRVAIDDPDRGFERSTYDPIGNVVCTASGERRGSLIPADIPPTGWAAVAAATCADTGRERKKLLRRNAFGYVGGLLVKVSPELLSGELKDMEFATQRSIETTYGRAEAAAVAQNTVGRIVSTLDATGREARQYDALGRAIRIERSFEKLAWKPSAPLVIDEVYDSWGPLLSRSMKITVPSADGRSNPLVVDEAVKLSYTVAGQPAVVLGRDPGTKADLAIANGFAYDARGNRLGMRYGTGIDVRMKYAPPSNRLIGLTAVMGQGGPDFPALKLQDLVYSYDPAGNVLAYDNVPGELGKCERRDDAGCVVKSETAQHYRLMVRSSMNLFAYDQLNRVRSAEKKLSTSFTARGRYTFPEYDREGEPQVIAGDELSRTQPLRLAFAESFAYDATHQMTELTRNSEATVGNERPRTTSVVARYQAGSQPRHAPSEIRSKLDGERSQDAPLTYDKLGRMESECSNDNSTCKEQRLFYWNVDDTLRRQITQTPDNVLSDKKQKAPGSTFYDQIESEYAGNGQRSYKKLSEYRVIERRRRGRLIKEKVITTRSETLYADPQLTITRGTTGTPQAVTHYFAGDLRLASRWAGDKNLFTYHPHLLTRNVSDIVIGEVGAPDTARLHSQTEYAAFGEVIHERESALVDQSDGVTSRVALGLPQYRFNAKELDESRLQDFGARFYDPKRAIWLRPDPILAEYLSGGRNGGVYAAKNLASYTFGWANPLSYQDIKGNYAAAPVQGNALAAVVPMSGTSGAIGIAEWFGGASALEGLGAAAISVLSRASIATVALSIPGDTPQRRTETLYVTYTRLYTDPEGDVHVYSGRTSGEIDKGLPNALQRSYAQAFISGRMRSKDHDSISAIGFGTPELDRYSTNYRAIRGREQLNIEQHGGAAMQGGTSANLINGISDFNPLRGHYINESVRLFGKD